MDTSKVSDASQSREGSSWSRSGLLNDSPSFQISLVQLDGSSNYLPWSKSCVLFIEARGLYDYLTIEMKKPTKDPLAINKWEAENSLIMYWLINSMQPHIARGYILLDTADKIWNVVS